MDNDAFERLHAILDEMQDELSMRQWDCTSVERCRRATALRSRLWKAVLAFGNEAARPPQWYLTVAKVTQ